MYGFTAYSPEGYFAYQEILEVPGARQPVVRDVDFDSGGNAAVGASARGGASGMIIGILLLDRGGRQTSYIDTGRYLPTHLAIAPDGSIWTLGWQRDAVSTVERVAQPDREDYKLVRHFSADGKQLNAYLPRSPFPRGIEPALPAAGVSMAVTQDKVALSRCREKPVPMPSGWSRTGTATCSSALE
jgi:hypothetical protein